MAGEERTKEVFGDYVTANKIKSVMTSTLPWRRSRKSAARYSKLNGIPSFSNSLAFGAGGGADL
jgi:hypothetical protein